MKKIIVTIFVLFAGFLTEANAVTAQFKNVVGTKGYVRGNVVVNENNKTYDCWFSVEIISETTNKKAKTNCDALDILASSEWTVKVVWSGYNVNLTALSDGETLARDSAEIVVQVLNPKNK